MERGAAIIEVGLNEAAVRTENPHVPYAPAECAEDARRCAEAGVLVPLPRDLQLQAAYTYLDATFRNSFKVCTAAPCTTSECRVSSACNAPPTCATCATCS